MNLTSLPREFSLKYPEHRYALQLLAASTVIMFIWQFFSGTELSALFLSAFNFSLIAFGAWLVGREIDPNHHTTALLAIPAMLLAPVSLQSGILVILLLVASVRAITEASGKKITELDIVVLVMGWMLFVGWILVQPSPRPRPEFGELMSFVFIAVISGFVMYVLRREQCNQDQGSKKVSGLRLTIGRYLILVVTIVLYMLNLPGKYPLALLLAVFAIVRVAKYLMRYRQIILR